MEKMKFLNTYVSNVTMDETIAEIEKYIKEDKKRYIVAINVDVVVKIENDKELQRQQIRRIWYWQMENH